MKFTIKDFFGKCDQILNGKLLFLYSAKFHIELKFDLGIGHYYEIEVCSYNWSSILKSIWDVGLKHLFHFCTHRKHRKTKGSLTFLGGIEIERWSKMC